MARAISMKMFIGFPLKEGETENDAIDRLRMALDAGVPGFVMSWQKPEIEEYEDDGPDDEESMKALREAEDIIAGRVDAKRYDSFAECLEDIMEE